MPLPGAPFAINIPTSDMAQFRTGPNTAFGSLPFSLRRFSGS